MTAINCNLSHDFDLFVVEKEGNYERKRMKSFYIHLDTWMRVVNKESPNYVAMKKHKGKNITE